MSENNTENAQPTGLQDRAERNVWLLAFLTFLTVSVAGLVEIVPLFYLDSAMPAKNIPGVVWDRGEGANQKTLEQTLKAGIQIILLPIQNK